MQNFVTIDRLVSGNKHLIFKKEVNITNGNKTEEPSNAKALWTLISSNVIWNDIPTILPTA